jgi:disulfide bond formation protein DsbB
MLNYSVLLRQLTTPRMMFLNIFIYCSIMALVSRLYFQGFLGLEPCPLCIVQRFFVIATALVVLLASIHNPGVSGRRIYSALALLPNLVGVITSIRHVWLQNLPPEKVPECGPGIDYIMEVFSLFEVLRMVLWGSGECSEVLWSFLGLTIPGWTLVAFIVMFSALCYQFVRAEK